MGFARIAAIIAAVFSGGGETPAPTPVFTPAPFASGDSAANIPLDGRTTRVLTRWVPNRTGVLEAFHVRVKLEGSSCADDGEYAGGDGGVLEAWVYRVAGSGAPAGRPLAHARVSPCEAEREQTIALPLDLRVRAGQEYATVVRNAATDPFADFFSLNFLFSYRGIQGANGRNERSARARDSFYGLDPRELVGYSTDGGRFWELPGGPYGGRGGRAFLPTYLLQWQDGTWSGQPYYYATPAQGESSMTFRVGDRPWTIRALGAYADEASQAPVELYVDGERKARVVMRGDGHIRMRITPVTAPAGSTVRLVVQAGEGGLALRHVFADGLWEDRLGLGPDHRFFADDADPAPLTIFPLPAQR